MSDGGFDGPLDTDTLRQTSDHHGHRPHLLPVVKLHVKVNYVNMEYRRFSVNNTDTLNIS